MAMIQNISSFWIWNVSICITQEGKLHFTLSFGNQYQHINPNDLWTIVHLSPDSVHKDGLLPEANTFVRLGNLLVWQRLQFYTTMQRLGCATGVQKTKLWSWAKWRKTFGQRSWRGRWNQWCINVFHCLKQPRVTGLWRVAAILGKYSLSLDIVDDLLHQVTE